MSSLSDRIAQLKRRASEVASQITALADRRRSYSFAASEGDAKARKSIGDIDFETDALKREAATVSDAIEIGEALEHQRLLDAEAEARREREIAAYKAARAVASLNLELDQELVRLREMFERRAALLKALGNSGTVDLGLITRLSHKSGATASAQLAGLSKYLALEMTPTSAMRPLATSNELLLKIGVEPPSGNGKDNGKPLLRPATNKRAEQ
jgi:hypothetical protein